MKPRQISETQRVRALSLGIKLVTPVIIPEVTRTYTDQGCVVESHFDAEGNEHVTLSARKARE